MLSDCVTRTQNVTRIRRILQGKWTLHILCAMREQPVRLSQLTRLIPSASKKALRAGLRDLEAAEIVVRRDLSDTVLHVEYDFANDMREAVCSLLDQLGKWGVVTEAMDGQLDGSIDG
jgi:DNA-binding HxlR family transcriptional regulator